jgi:hypothetical protein
MADYPEYELRKNTLTSIVKNSDNLGFQLPQDSVVILTDASTKRFRRGGAPDSYGSDQRDILVVSKDGSIDMKAPLNWDYEQVSSIRITGHRKSQEISIKFSAKTRNLSCKHGHNIKNLLYY